MGYVFKVCTPAIYISLNIAICKILMFLRNDNVWKVYFFLALLDVISVSSLVVTFRFCG